MTPEIFTPSLVAGLSVGALCVGMAVGIRLGERNIERQIDFALSTGCAIPHRIETVHVVCAEEMYVLRVCQLRCAKQDEARKPPCPAAT